VALYPHKEITTEQFWERLGQTDLPKLWVPKREHLYAVGSTPVLGTGKVDLRQAKMMAVERARG
jgi:acyl-[acyl-carrier-protein]-phospholipid O-acyltransferase/long-chain-fatty-acid--[acyl-carrier-protein] ligase